VEYSARTVGLIFDQRLIANQFRFIMGHEIVGECPHHRRVSFLGELKSHLDYEFRIGLPPDFVTPHQPPLLR
jgi:hypothetical protein